MRERERTHGRPRPSALQLPRDRPESAFAAILGALVARIPGARAAALVDFEGETVDYAGRGDPYEVRVAAAHWRIVFDEVAAQPSMRRVQQVGVRAARRGYIVCALPEGYALIVVLTRAAGFAGHDRALAVCARALGREAGWTWSEGERPALWFPLDVVADVRLRPRAVREAGNLRPVEILGALVSRSDSLPRPRERGWRVRFDTGVEAMLLREPGGAWYADEPLESAPSPGERPQQPRGRLSDDRREKKR
jgi:hypothetical protein